MIVTPYGPQMSSWLSDVGGRLVAARRGVDGDGDEQDRGGPDVLGRGAQAEQFQAVVDHGHDDPAEDRAHHLAPAAEQAGAADHRGGHREQDVVPALDVGGDRAEVGGEDDAHDAGGQPGQGEGDDPDPVQVDARAPGRLGVAADGVDVPAEPGPAEQEAVGHEHDQDHQHHPRHAVHDQQEPAAVGVADQHHDHAGHRHGGDLQPGHAGGRRGELAGPPAAVADHEQTAGQHHGHDHDDPADQRAHGAALDVVQHVAVQPDGPAGVGGGLVDDVQQEAQPGQLAGQRDHEGRQPEPGDDDALDGAPDRGHGQADQHRERPRPGIRRHQHPAGEHRADRRGEADRQVDLAEQQDEHLGHAQHHDPRGLGNQVDQVARGQEQGVAGLEVDDDGHQAEQDGQEAAVAAAHPDQEDLGVLAERVGDDLGSGQGGVGRGLVGIGGVGGVGGGLSDLSAHWGSL